jgi:hypothetical protein
MKRFYNDERRIKMKLTHIKSFIKRMKKVGMPLDYQKIFLKVYLKDFYITAIDYILNEFYESSS